MNFWITLWTVLLFSSLIAFAGLAVVVTVRGFSDVRGMLSGVADKRRNGSDRSRAHRP